jgi:hypothetical protein
VLVNRSSVAQHKQNGTRNLIAIDVALEELVDAGKAIDREARLNRRRSRVGRALRAQVEGQPRQHEDRQETKQIPCHYNLPQGGNRA